MRYRQDGQAVRCLARRNSAEVRGGLTVFDLGGTADVRAAAAADGDSAVPDGAAAAEALAAAVLAEDNSAGRFVCFRVRILFLQCLPKYSRPVFSLAADNKEIFPYCD